MIIIINMNYKLCKIRNNCEYNEYNEYIDNKCDEFYNKYLFMIYYEKFSLNINSIIMIIYLE